jgi:hypothetical protein
MIAAARIACWRDAGWATRDSGQQLRAMQGQGFGQNFWVIGY